MSTLARYISGGLLVVLTTSIFLFGISFVYAQPSYTMNYQGKLTNNSGLAVADGTYAMEFKLYTQSSGGSAIWTETRSGGNVVTVTNGLFSVMLGSVTSLSSVNFNQPLYLGVNVASDGEMTPRKALGTVPSAFEAKQLGGVASTSFLRSDAADSASGLLTFTGGVVSTASSSIARFNFTNATGTSLYIGGDRITDFSGTNLEVVGNSLGLSSTYLGQTSITTLGTVGTGTWQGSVISSAYLDTSTILSTEIDTSAELAGILGDETGYSGGALAVFSISPVITGTADFVAGDFSSTLNMSGSAANIALGSNYLSGDGGDEGVFVSSSGYVGIGTTTPNNLLQVYDLINFNNTDFNSFLGYQSGKYFASGATINTFVGYRAGYGSSTASTNGADGNTGVGSRSLSSNTIGYYNAAFGSDALLSNTGGFHNTAIGTRAIDSNLVGFFNVAVGADALQSNTSSHYNTAIGAQAAYSSTGGAAVAVGYQSSYSNTTGYGNVVLGFQSFYSNTTGSYNVAAGFAAGRYLNDGATLASTTDYSIFLGNNAKAFTNNDQNTIVIGYNTNGIGSNTVVLGNDSIVTTALKGNVGIGTTTPNQKLSIFANAADAAIELSTVSGANEKWTIGIDDSDSAKFKISSSSALGTNDRLVINGDGKVGIGNSSPAGQLDIIAGSASTKGLIIKGGASANMAELYDSSSNLKAWFTSVGALNLQALPSTAGVSANSPGQGFASTYWNGSASVAETIYIQNTRYGGGGGAAGAYRLAIGTANPDNAALSVAGDGSNTVSINYPYPQSSLDAQFYVVSSAATKKGMIIKGAASQSDSLMELQNSGGTSLFTVNSSGIISTSDNLTPNAIFSTGQADEECLTYEATGTTFEWQSCGTGYLASTDIDTSAELAAIVGDETGTGALVFGTNPTLTGNTVTLSSLTASRALFLGSASQATTTATSAFLLNSLTDETGTGVAVFATSPTLVTPNLGTPSTLVGTNITGTAAGLTAGTVTTNANLTGAITSTGNATVLGSFTSSNLLTALTDETGTGNAVFSASPTFTGTVNAAAATLSSTLTLSGSAANIALGSNYLSGDGDDEGVFVSSTGNVGIGTSSPSSRLDVAGDIELGNNAKYLYSVTTAGTRVRMLGIAGTDVAYIGPIDTGPVAAIVNASVSSTYLDFNTLGLTRARFTSTGNFGIGDTSADNLLDISSSTAQAALAIFSGGTDTDALIKFELTDNTPSFTMGVDDSDGDKFKISTTALGTNDRLVIDSSGNVGIGTTTPGALLDVQGAAQFGTSNIALITSAGKITGLSSTYFTADTSANLATILSDESGTGVVAYTTNPVFTTPNLGTPSAVTLTNGTGLPIVAGTTGTLTETRGGTNQTTYATGDMLYASGANTLAKRTIGSTGNILTVSGGVPTWAATSSLGFLATSSINTSAKFAGLLTDETGTGSAVFSASPTFTGTAIFANTGIQVGTSVPFSDAAGTLTIQNIDALDATTETTIEAAIDTLGSLTSASSLATVGTITSGTWGGAFSNNIVTPNAIFTTGQTDEYCLTYEATGTTFEWQSCASGFLASTDIDTSAELDTIVTDNTGSGALVFGTSPTFTTYANFGSAGVRLSDDGDGGLTFLGLGNGSDEDLKLDLDNTANTGVFTSSTGLNQLTFSGIGINTTAATGYSMFGTGYLYASTTNDSISLGESAGRLYNGGALGNVAVGFQAGYSATSSDYNSFFGYQAGFSDTSASYNVAIGYQALYTATSSSGNIAIGRNALRSLNGPGSGLVAVGYEALYSNTSGTLSVALGQAALRSNTSGSQNIGIGYGAGYWNTTGSDNVFIGQEAAAGSPGLTTGSSNVAVGRLAFNAYTTGTGNSVLGRSALGTNKTGSNNVALGYLAGTYNGAATNTVAVGTYSSYGAAVSYSNQGGTTVGYQSGYSFQTGSHYNTLIGFDAGYNITTGQYNTYLGSFGNTGGVTTGSNNILIGQDVRSGLTVTASNQLNVGNLLYGTGLGSGTTLSTGKIGIGTSTPNQKLSIFASAADSAIEFSTVTGSAEKWTIGIDDSDSAKFKISSSSALGTNDRFVIDGAGKIGINDATPDGFFDIDTPTTFTSGSIYNAAAAGATTLAGALNGINLDLSTNYTATNFNSRGVVVTLPTVTNTSTGNYKYRGFVVSGGAVTHNTGAGTSQFDGLFVTNSNITQTAPATSVTSNGLTVNTGTITTAGTQTGVNVVATGVGAGTLYGVSIGAITAGAGTETAFEIGSGWDTYLNTATLDITGAGAITGATAITTSGDITLSGSAANILLGSNYLSGDGGDEGIAIDSGGTMSITQATGNTVAAIFTDGTSAISVIPNLGTGGYNPLSVAGDLGILFRGSGSSDTASGLTIAPWDTQEMGLRMYTDGGASMTTSIMGGNVGVGTTTPNQALSIFRSAADSAIEFSTVSGSAEKWTIGIDDSDSAKFKISSSSALGTNDRFVINGSGYVGIGDSTPASLFTVGSGDLFQVNSSGQVAAGAWQGTAISSTYLDTGVILSTEIDTSAELAAILGDETGTAGSVVFSASPTFTGTISGAAITASGNVTLSGSAANILLGSNFLSGDGGDEGISVDSSGNVGALQDQFSVCSGGACASTANGDGTITAERAITSEEGTVTAGAGITLNWDDGNQQYLSLTTNSTIGSFTNNTTGQTLRLVVCQDATGGRTFTFSPTIKWSAGTTPTQTSTANKCDVYSFIQTTAGTLGSYNQNF